MNSLLSASYCRFAATASSHSPRPGPLRQTIYFTNRPRPTRTTISSITGCGCAAKGSNTVNYMGRILIRALFYGRKMPARSRGVGMSTISSSVSTTASLRSVKASRNTFSPRLTWVRAHGEEAQVEKRTSLVTYGVVTQTGQVAS